MPRFGDKEIAAILAGRTEPKKVFFKPLDCEIAIAPLTDTQIDGAKLAAQRFCKMVGADVEIDPDFLDREIQRQTIWRATFDAATIREDKPQPFFPADSDVRGLDSALVQALWLLYLEIQEAIIPNYTLDEKGIEELTDALKKGRPEVLTVLSQDTLRACVRSMACALRGETSLPGKSSITAS